MSLIPLREARKKLREAGYSTAIEFGFLTFSRGGSHWGIPIKEGDNVTEEAVTWQIQFGQRGTKS